MPATGYSPAPPLGSKAMLRWFWRQLTSMRTALILLLLLAIAAVPGSLIPQRAVDSRATEAYFARNPKLAPWLDRLGLFDVYTSPWFSAIYILLMISLVGCIVPRTLVYLRALRARPPKAPRRLDRLSAYGSFETDRSVEEVAAIAKPILRGSPLLPARVDVVMSPGPNQADAVQGTSAELETEPVDSAEPSASADRQTSEVRAEKGYLRELGNLVFHISIVLVLIGVAVGSLYGYRGAAIVPQGSGFANVLTQYDEFGSGALFDADELPPFSLQLDRMEARFWTEGPQRGAPRMFRATGTYESKPGEPREGFDIRVNHPLAIDGSSVFLVGQGYAPIMKVTDARGNVVFNGPIPFLPQDGTYTSNGVIKVPDAQPKQLAFQGFFLPTAVAGGDQGVSVSVFPGAVNPLLGMFVYEGDLGLDDGRPQSVYTVDKANMKQIKNENGKPFRISLSPGQRQDLPNGGSIEFVDLTLFARFQIASTPLATLPLTAISVGIGGLILSLVIRPRRTWVRSRREGSRTVVEVAAIDRLPRDDLPDELDDLLERLETAMATASEDADTRKRATA